VTRAAIYARISNDKEGQRFGVERQRQDCLALCERNGWTVAGEYVDNDISAAKLPGKREKVRPEYDRMVADIQAQRVDAVVAYSQSRLTRKGTIEDFIDLCEANGIEGVAIVTGAPINPGGNLMTARVQAAVDAEYVRKLSEDGRRAKYQHAKEGRRSGGPRPFGYSTGNYPTIIESEAARIRAAADALIDGTGTLSSIARQWNADGLTTTAKAGDGHWTSQTLHKLLSRPVMVARIEYEHDGTHGPAGTIEVFAGKWLPILTDQKFADVQAILEDPTRRPNRTGAAYPLLGVMRCFCGEAMTAKPTGSRDHQPPRRRYGCNRHDGPGSFILADQVEQWVLGQLLALADKPRVGQIIRDLEGHEDEAAARLRVRVAEANAAVEDLMSSVGQAGVKFDHVRGRVAELTQDIERAEAELAALAGRSALDKFAGRAVEDFNAGALTLDDVRAICLSLVHGVLVLKANQKEGITGLRRVGFAWKAQALADIAIEGLGFGEDGTVYHLGPFQPVAS
jgi:site-specific DNA recombinase